MEEAIVKGRSGSLDVESGMAAFCGSEGVVERDRRGGEEEDILAAGFGVARALCCALNVGRDEACTRGCELPTRLRPAREIVRTYPFPAYHCNILLPTLFVICVHFIAH